MLDQRHALYKLADQIEWHRAEDQFGSLYSDEGRPGIPTRIMVGLHYLKHAFDLSDEAVVEQWIENPYWQYFCGALYFQHSLPIDPSQMTRFRKRIGGVNSASGLLDSRLPTFCETGCEFMLGF